MSMSSTRRRKKRLEVIALFIKTRSDLMGEAPVKEEEAPVGEKWVIDPEREKAIQGVYRRYASSSNLLADGSTSTISHRSLERVLAAMGLTKESVFLDVGCGGRNSLHCVCPQVRVSHDRL